MSRFTPRQRDYAAEGAAGAVARGPSIGAGSAGHPLFVDPAASSASDKKASLSDSSSSSASSLSASGATVKKTELVKVMSRGAFVDPLSGLSAAPSDPLGGSSPVTSSKAKVVVDDPLSASASPSAGTKKSTGSSDPLSSSSSSTSKAAAGSPASSSSDGAAVGVESNAAGFVPWASKRVGILSRYTADQSIGVSASYLEGAEEVAAATAAAQQSKGQQMDRAQQRLAQLEQSDEHRAKETLKLDQKDYEAHIQNLHDTMISSWNSDDKVKSLKIAIQCAKLLGDTSVIRFYPSKFVLITEILDSFGKLVYQRINDSGADDERHEVSEKARGTCRNWFYKIASIRELLPRLYVEMAILRSIRFIQQGTFPTVINRLAAQCRGLGDPLVSVYARAYLARKAHEVAPLEIQYLKTVFSDHVTNQSVIQSRRFRRHIARQKHTQQLNWSDYLDLYSPALDWILQCVGSSSHINAELFDWVLEEYERGGKNPFVLKHIISSFNPKLISFNARKLVKLVADADDSVFPKYQLYTSLGVVFSLEAPPRNHIVGILNDVWSSITKMKDIREYLAVAEVFVDFPLRYLSNNETDILLGDVLAHVTPVRESALASSLGTQRRRKRRSRKTPENKETAEGAEDEEGADADDGEEPTPTAEAESDPAEKKKAKSEKSGKPDENNSNPNVAADAATRQSNDVTEAEELYEDIQVPLQSLIEKIMLASKSVSEAFSLTNLVPLLDCFTGEAQISTYKSILKTFGQEEQNQERERRRKQQERDAAARSGDEETEDDGEVDVLATTNNPQLVHAIFTIGKAVHDSVNTLTFADEKRQISVALCAFVQKINYGRNFEKQLDFYADCRRAFGGLDSVKESLVLGACNLAAKTLELVRGNHNARTTAFVRAALAFCFITVPSMESVQTRLKLYLVVAECALLNGAVSQADGLLKAAVKLLQETPKTVDSLEGRRSTLSWVYRYIGDLCGLLVQTPGHPEQGPFYLVKGLVQVIHSYDWDDQPSQRPRAFLSVLPLLTTLAQKKLPYACPRVEANDSLYNLDPEYVTELDAITNKVLETMLEDIAALGNADQSDEHVAALASKDQARLSLDLMNQVVAFCELNAKSAKFCLNLFGLVKKYLAKDQDASLAAYAKQTVRYVQNKGTESNLARELHKALIA